MATGYWPQTYLYWPKTYLYWPKTFPYWPEYGVSDRRFILVGPGESDVMTIDGDDDVTFSCIPTGPGEAPTENYQFANKKYTDDGIATHAAVAAPHSGHVDTTGNETIAGVKTFSSTPVGPSAAPTTNYQLANKKYGDDTFAPIAKGVTNGDSHDHVGGDGGEIDHVNLANKGTNTHAQIDAHIADTAYCKIQTLTYTGDGSTSYHIDTTIHPIYVRIWMRVVGDDTLMYVYETTDTIIDDNANGQAVLIIDDGSGDVRSRTNAIILLDADGFVVDDDGADTHPNKSGQVYNVLVLGY